MNRAAAEFPCIIAGRARMIEIGPGDLLVLPPVWSRRWEATKLVAIC